MSMKYLQVPNEEQRESARKAVNSTKDSVKSDVQYLIKWMRKQPHLPNFKDELAHCLLNCKNSLEKCKLRLEMYFYTKALLPEIFHDRNPFEKKIELQTRIGMYVPLRKLTPDGYRVVMVYLSDNLKTEINHSIIESFFKINQMTIDVLGKYDYPKGVIVFYDVKNITMPLVAAFSPHLQKLVLLVQMEILKNASDISKILPKEIIPRDYGGDELPLEELKDLWYDELKSQLEYLKNTEEMMSDLSKISKDCTKADLTDLNGSFRQISID